MHFTILPHDFSNVTFKDYIGCVFPEYAIIYLIISLMVDFDLASNFLHFEK